MRQRYLEKFVVVFFITEVIARVGSCQSWCASRGASQCASRSCQDCAVCCSDTDNGVKVASSAALTISLCMWNHSYLWRTQLETDAPHTRMTPPIAMAMTRTHSGSFQSESRTSTYLTSVASTGTLTTSPTVITVTIVSLVCIELI